MSCNDITSVGCACDVVDTVTISGVENNAVMYVTQFNGTSINSNTMTVVTITADYTVTLSVDMVVIDSNTAILTLPTAVGNEGESFIVKCIGSLPTTASVTSVSMIDTSASYVFTSQNESIRLASDGTSWLII